MLFFLCISWLHGADLLAAVWPNVHVSDWVLTTCIREIRHVLGDVARAPQYIATVHRQGYRFIAPVTVVATPPPLSVPAAPPQPPHTAPSACEAPPSAPTAAALEEEHKLVTILCGALAEAPVLAARLGPEPWYRLLQTVVGLTQEVLQDYTGTLTLVTGDGFTAVFGAPVAQEDHARRAVLAALELRQRLQDAPALRTQLAGGVLALGMGLHSGLVVGGLGQDPQRLATAVGAPLYVATRLQQRSAPGTILLSAATYHLVHEEVRATPYETFAMGGQPAPMSVYAVQGLLRRHAGVAGWGLRALSPFVGRARELALLHDRLAAAVAGQGQVVGLVGEPGMGKSRPLVEFCHSVPEHQGTYYVGQCLSYGSATPYLSVLDLLRAYCGITPANSLDTLIEKVRGGLQAVGMEPDAGAPYLLYLLGVEVGTEQLAGTSPEALKVKTFETLRQLMLQRSQQHPLILAVEDLHWSDPTSAEFFASLVERLPGAALLFLGTYRPGYRPAWIEKSYAAQLTVPPLSAPDSVQLLRAVLQTETIPAPLTQVLLTKAQGNPFFLEELAQTLVEQGGVGGGAHGHSPLPTPSLSALQLPPSAPRAPSARIDRLAHGDKYLLQCAAIIGMEVPVPLLQAITEWPEAALQQGLAHLQAAEFLYETRVVGEFHYTFKHALTQEVAYQSVLQSTRQQYHQRIAQVLEQQFPETIETQPELLAHHYTEAGLSVQAIPYWQRAGQRASERSAYVEAIAHLSKGLELLASLPDTPERGPTGTHVVHRPWYGIEVYRGLCGPGSGRHLSPGARTVPACGGDPTARPSVDRPVGILYQSWRVPDRTGAGRANAEPGPAGPRSRMLHECSYRAGECLELPRRVGLCPRAPRARDRPLLGAGLCPLPAPAALLPWPHQPTSRGAWPVPSRPSPVDVWLPRPGLAAEPGGADAGSRVLAPLQRGYCPVLCCPDPLLAPGGTSDLRAGQCRAHAVGKAGVCTPAGTGNDSAGLGAGRAGAGGGWNGADPPGAGRPTGQWGVAATHLHLLAEASWKAGQIEEGLRATAEALVLMDRSESRGVAELYRLKGVLLLACSSEHHAEAESYFREALEAARSQQAKSWELRAAMSLSRLWQQQGKQTDAQRLLTPIYSWFTEGFDTADLRDARVLLDTFR